MKVSAIWVPVRWIPTDRMLADSLTKDKGDPVDLLRSCMKSARYQISPEPTVLERQAAERRCRLLRGRQRQTSTCPGDDSYVSH